MPRPGLVWTMGLVAAGSRDNCWTRILARGLLSINSSLGFYQLDSEWGIMMIIIMTRMPLATIVG